MREHQKDSGKGQEALPAFNLQDRLRVISNSVERQIQVKDVDAWFAEQAELPGGCVPGDELANLSFSEAAGFGDTGRLEIRVVRGDVGVEPRAGGGDHVNGNGLALVLRSQLIDVALNALNELGIGLGQV